MNVTRTTTWSSGNTLTAAALNNEFNNLLNSPNIVNADIAAGAGIVYSKLNLTGSVVDSDISNAAAISASKINDTAITQTATQTMSNKTLTKPVVNGSVPAFTTDVDGATVTLSMLASNIHRVVLGGNRTLAVSNVSTGQCFIIILQQDGTGSRTVSWFSGILWTNGNVPTLTTTNGKQDVFGFIYDGTNYLGFTVGQNI